jgi:hypothetical protein
VFKGLQFKFENNPQSRETWPFNVVHKYFSQLQGGESTKLFDRLLKPQLITRKITEEDLFALDIFIKEMALYTGRKRSNFNPLKLKDLAFRTRRAELEAMTAGRKRTRKNRPKKRTRRV